MLISAILLISIEQAVVYLDLSCTIVLTVSYLLENEHQVGGADIAGVWGGDQYCRHHNCGFRVFFVEPFEVGSAAVGVLEPRAQCGLYLCVKLIIITDYSFDLARYYCLNSVET